MYGATKKAILQILVAKPSINLIELADTVGRSKSTVYHHLTELQSQGAIRRGRCLHCEARIWRVTTLAGPR